MSHEVYKYALNKVFRIEIKLIFFSFLRKKTHSLFMKLYCTARNFEWACLLVVRARLHSLSEQLQQY